MATKARLLGNLVAQGQPLLEGFVTQTYVDNKVAALVNSAPATLDTLKEIADQLAADQSAVAAITTTLGTKANISSLAQVATSGSYADLTNKPTLFSGSYADLTNKPTLFSGSYADLTNKPNIVSTDAQSLTSTEKTNAKTNLDLQNVENKSSATIRGELTSSNVTTALGFTPYNATNPNGYITASALSNYLTISSAASTYLPLSGGTLTGNLLLGTTTDVSARLHVSGTDAAVILRVNTDNVGTTTSNYSEIQLSDVGTPRAYWRNVRDGSGATIFSYNDHLRFAYQGTERARFASTGDLLIGYTSNTFLGSTQFSLLSYRSGANTIGAAGGTYTVAQLGQLYLSGGYGDGGTRVSGYFVRSQASGGGGTVNNDLLFVAQTNNGTSEVERARITSTGAWSFGSSGTATGTAGQVLTSNGSGSAPSWQSVSSSQWVTSGSNIYYAAGLVGVNTSLITSGVDSGQLQVYKPAFVNSSSIAYAIAVTGGTGNGFSGTETGGIKIKVLPPNFITTYGIHVDQTAGGTGQTKYAGYFLSTSGQSNVSSYGIYSEMSASTGDGLYATNYSIYSNAVGSAANNVVYALYAKTDNRANAVAMYVEDSYSTSASKNTIVFSRNGSAVGTITTTLSATAYNTSSDYRLKENVQVIQNALDDVMRMRPVTYDWIETGGNGIGFIAHELQEIVPHAVHGAKDQTKFVTKKDETGKMMVNSDGSPKLFEEPVYQGVDSSFLVPHLVKAIQELKAEFDAYKVAHP
jgi:hypothetical protein